MQNDPLFTMKLKPCYVLLLLPFFAVGMFLVYVALFQEYSFSLAGAVLGIMYVFFVGISGVRLFFKQSLAVYEDRIEILSVWRLCRSIVPFSEVLFWKEIKTDYRGTIYTTISIRSQRKLILVTDKWGNYDRLKKVLRRAARLHEGDQIPKIREGTLLSSESGQVRDMILGILIVLLMFIPVFYWRFYSKTWNIYDTSFALLVWTNLYLAIVVVLYFWLGEKVDILEEKVVFQSNFNKVRSVVLRSDILTWNETRKGKVRTLAICTDKQCNFISSADYLNYNDLKRELVRGKKDGERTGRFVDYKKRYRLMILALCFVMISIAYLVGIVYIKSIIL